MSLSHVHVYVPDVLDTLIDWAIEGLDLDKAIQQPETAHKVRHIKMGIKLTAALCTCDSFIAFRMLVCLFSNLQCIDMYKAVTDAYKQTYRK